MLSTCYSCWLSQSATDLQKALTEKLTLNFPSMETKRNTDTLRLEDLQLFYCYDFLEQGTCSHPSQYITQKATQHHYIQSICSPLC